MYKNSNILIDVVQHYSKLLYRAHRRQQKTNDRWHALRVNVTRGYRSLNYSARLSSTDALTRPHVEPLKRGLRERQTGGDPLPLVGHSSDYVSSGRLCAVLFHWRVSRVQCTLHDHCRNWHFGLLIDLPNF